MLQYAVFDHPCLFSLVSASESSLVETESIGHVFVIGINRPEKRNCVNQAAAQQLWDAVRHFETNEELRVAVLYGKGLVSSRVAQFKSIY